jgi:hypothetical protein
MDDVNAQIIAAIRSVKTRVRWSPGSAARHLLKRKLRGHLPAEATITDYERIIRSVLEDPQARIYLYHHGEATYVTVVAVIQNRHWLVMFSIDGLTESAFVIDRPDRYLNRSVFELVGLLEEVLT